MLTMLTLYPYIKNYKFKFIIACLSSTLNKICDVLPEIILGVAVNVAAGKSTFLEAYFGIQSLYIQLIILSILVFFIWTLESIFEYAQNILWQRIAQLIQKKLRLDTFWHVMHLSMDHLESKNPGDLTTVINDDINQLERFLDVGINAFIHLIVGTLIIGIVFFVSVPMLSILVIFPIPLVLWIAFYFQKILSTRYKTVRKAAGRIGVHLTNTFLGIVTVKSYSTEKYELRHLKQKSTNFQERNREVAYTRAIFTPIIRMVIVFGFISTLLIGGIAVLNNSLSLGVYSMLMFLIQRLLWPFIKLPDIINLYQRASASLNRVLDLLHTPINIKDNTQSTLKPKQGSISFKDVTFCYPHGVCIFDKLSFNIKPHQTVAFIGGTGSGKSTIANLLLRLYPDYQGTILLDNSPIQDYPLHNLRNAIGYVSQEPFLIDGSIAENIAYGSFNATQDQIIKAAKDAQAYDFIMKLPNEFESQVGEQGQQLSGGQKQRISIARALLKNPLVYIFDEVTSGLDNETESQIQGSLESLTNNKTVIIIAHRLSTIKNADIIYVMDHGTIVESGTHKELLEKNGLYTQLWKTQINKDVCNLCT